MWGLFWAWAQHPCCLCVLCITTVYNSTHYSCLSVNDRLQRLIWWQSDIGITRYEHRLLIKKIGANNQLHSHPSAVRYLPAKDVYYEYSYFVGLTVNVGHYEYSDQHLLSTPQSYWQFLGMRRGGRSLLAALRCMENTSTCWKQRLEMESRGAIFLRNKVLIYFALLYGVPKGKKPHNYVIQCWSSIICLRQSSIFQVMELHINYEALRWSKTLSEGILRCSREYSPETRDIVWVPTARQDRKSIS